MTDNQIKERLNSIGDGIRCIHDHTGNMPLQDLICSIGATESRLRILREKLEQMNEESIDELLGVKQGPFDEIPIGDEQDQQLHDAVGVDDWKYWDYQ